MTQDSRSQLTIAGEPEKCGKYSLIRYAVPTDDGLTLSLLRVDSQSIKHPNPLVLVHGSYTNRRFFISPKGKGLAGFLSEAGFDVWILETRGHGGSLNPEKFRSITAEDVIRHDYASAQQAIASVVSAPQIYIGHSFGGLFLLGALSMAYLKRDALAAFAVFGTQISYGQSYLKIPLVAQVIKGVSLALGKFPATKLGWGSEDEPPGIMAQELDWKRTGRWENREGVPFTRGLVDVQIPALFVAGGGDTFDPAKGSEELFAALGSRDKQFLLLSQKTGFSQDFGHVDMLIGSKAESEVWPHLLKWLQPFAGP